jgi:ABC-type multidrug transport system permease subunit
MSAINEIFNIFIQYLPLIFTVGIIFGIVNYALGGFGGLLGNITGLFGGT